MKGREVMYKCMSYKVMEIIVKRKAKERFL